MPTTLRQQVVVGKPLGIIYTYSYNGLWQWDDKRETMDLMKDGSIGGDTYYPGENKIADLDGDNKITTADRKIVGFTDPKWYGGLSSTLIYKNFSLDLNFNYVYGNKIFNRSYHEYTLGAGYGFIIYHPMHLIDGQSITNQVLFQEHIRTIWTGCLYQAV
ncbi:MAG: hypothetical protein HC905_25825 [Bacteroidales bacterium]|nr:hypothetical protein [Bacteroidales bacterium]